MYKRIIVPVDSSETLSEVVAQVTSISSGWEDCSITILHVETPVRDTSLGSGIVPAGTGIMPIGIGVTPAGTNILPPGTGVVPGLDDDHEQRLEPEECRILDQAKPWVGTHNIEREVVFKRGDPAKEICRYAEEELADLIIVGKHDKGLLEKLFLGSVSQKVIENAPCHVLVLK